MSESVVGGGNEKSRCSVLLVCKTTLFLFQLYLYFSVSKFEMVSSRLGLAIAATFTIIATLLVATGSKFVLILMSFVLFYYLCVNIVV